MVYLLVGDNRPMGMNRPDAKDKDNSLAIRNQVVDQICTTIQSLYMQQKPRWERYSPKAPGVDQHSHQRGIGFTITLFRTRWGSISTSSLLSPCSPIQISFTSHHHIHLVSHSFSFQVGDRRGQGQADVECGPVRMWLYMQARQT
jgi:hypothetical protein